MLPSLSTLLVAPLLAALVGSVLLSLVVFIHDSLFPPSSDSSPSSSSSSSSKRACLPSLHYRESSLNAKLLARCGLRQREFRPPWWLRSPHVQTVLAAFWPRAGDSGGQEVTFQREYLQMRDKGVVALDWVISVQPRVRRKATVLLVIPPVTGSAHTVSALCWQATKRGLRTVVFNRRGHGSSVLTTAKLLNAADPSDLRQVVKYLRLRFPKSRLAAVSYGTGCGLLLSYLGEFGSSALLATGACVSPCYDTVERFSGPLRSLYDFAYLLKLKWILLRHAKALSGLLDVRQALLKSWNFGTYEERVYCRMYTNHSVTRTEPAAASRHSGNHHPNVSSTTTSTNGSVVNTGADASSSNKNSQNVAATASPVGAGATISPRDSVAGMTKPANSTSGVTTSVTTVAKATNSVDGNSMSPAGNGHARGPGITHVSKGDSSPFDVRTSEEQGQSPLVTQCQAPSTRSPSDSEDAPPKTSHPLRVSISKAQPTALKSVVAKEQTKVSKISNPQIQPTSLNTSTSEALPAKTHSQHQPASSKTTTDTQSPSVSGPTSQSQSQNSTTQIPQHKLLATRNASSQGSTPLSQGTATASSTPREPLPSPSLDSNLTPTAPTLAPAPTTQCCSGGGLEEYWDRTNPIRDVDDIAVPVLCINSLDDPFHPGDAIPYDLFRCCPNFLLVVTERGGHCGFLEGYPFRSWADALCLDYLEAVFELTTRGYSSSSSSSSSTAGIGAGVSTTGLGSSSVSSSSSSSSAHSRRNTRSTI